MTRRRTTLLVAGAIAGSVLVNIGLFGLASLLSSERERPADMTEPVAVSLVKLAPPKTAEPEEVKEPTPPKQEPKSDFTPDLVRPDLALGSNVDVGVAVDLGGIRRSDMGGEFVFEAYELDQPPQVLVRVPPVYPYKAREQGIEGVVQVKLLVNSDGTVGAVQILDARPKGIFEDAVRKSVPQWKFSPGKIEGATVTAWVVTAVRFEF